MNDNYNNKDYDRNSNNDESSNLLASDISEDFKKIDFKYFIDSIKKSNEDLMEKIRKENKNMVNTIVTSFKEFLESLKERNSEENINIIYKMMDLLRYENHVFLKEQEERQNKLIQDIFKKQREENMTLLWNFILILNDEGSKKEK